MLKNMMFKGLFKRLLAAGFDPITAGELAAANYPSKKNQPTKPPVVSSTQVNQITEQFLGGAMLDRREVWERVWGMSPESYFGVKFDS
jgi:hypothetical protein